MFTSHPAHSSQVVMMMKYKSVHWEEKKEKGSKPNEKIKSHSTDAEAASEEKTFYNDRKKISDL